MHLFYGYALCNLASIQATETNKCDLIWFDWRRQLWGIGACAPPRLCSVIYYLPCIRERGMFWDDFVCRV